MVRVKKFRLQLNILAILYMLELFLMLNDFTVPFLMVILFFFEVLQRFFFYYKGVYAYFSIFFKSLMV